MLYQGAPTIQPTNTGNRNFAWETNHKFEIALQLGFIENKINFEASWYRNRSSNQLIGDPLPPSTGNTSLTANRPATVQNSGLEFITDFKILSKKKIQWITSMNLAIPRNKLVKYPNLESSSDADSYIIGEPLSIRKVFNVKRINSSTGLYDIEDVDGNGVLNIKER